MRIEDGTQEEQEFCLLENESQEDSTITTVLKINVTATIVVLSEKNSVLSCAGKLFTPMFGF